MVVERGKPLVVRLWVRMCTHAHREGGLHRRKHHEAAALEHQDRHRLHARAVRHAVGHRRDRLDVDHLPHLVAARWASSILGEPLIDAGGVEPVAADEGGRVPTFGVQLAQADHALGW